MQIVPLLFLVCSLVWERDNLADSLNVLSAVIGNNENTVEGRIIQTWMDSQSNWHPRWLRFAKIKKGKGVSGMHAHGQSAMLRAGPFRKLEMTFSQRMSKLWVTLCCVSSLAWDVHLSWVFYFLWNFFKVSRTLRKLTSLAFCAPIKLCIYTHIKNCLTLLFVFPLIFHLPLSYSEKETYPSLLSP